MGLDLSAWNSSLPDVQVKFIRTAGNAILPTKAYNEDNCFDLYATETVVIPAGGSAVVPVGLTVAYITPGFGFTIKPRSGLGFKNSLQPHLGEIDNGYRGDLAIKVYNFNNGLKFEGTTGPSGTGSTDDTSGTSTTTALLSGELVHDQTLDYTINAGKAFAQFKIEKVYKTSVTFTDTITPSYRGANGLGSSG